jgi:hypothetical protein
MRMGLRSACLVAVLAGGSCSTSLGGGAQPRQIPEAQVDRALAIAREYKSYGRVDDELRWAPFLCRQPLPGIARQSASRDAPTHGQKLYSVFVKDHAAYPTMSPSDQVVVKESFVAEPVTDPSAMFSPSAPPGEITDDHFYPYAQKDGVVYHAGAFAGLFVMYRADGADPSETDDGWIYATVSPDETVTASGRVASCMGCHENAPHGRLFGVPTSPSF